MRLLLVIPTIRTVRLDYIQPLVDLDTIVVDDSDGSVSKSGWPSNVQVIDSRDRRELLGAADRLVPRGSPSCKGVGLYLAWKWGYDGTVLLDDDCDCSPEPRFLDKIPIGKTVEVHRGPPGPWLNTLELLGEQDLYARGFPYEERGLFGERNLTETLSAVPKFNQGMWSFTPDVNGIDKLREQVLASGRAISAERRCSGYTRVEQGQRLPHSIMNAQVHRDLIPAFYQPPDYDTPSGFKVRRHDDVWSASFCKALMDLKGDTMTAGEPVCWHRKEGDILRETVTEHIANLIQSHVTAAIDRSVEQLTGQADHSYADLASALGTCIRAESSKAPGWYARLIDDYGRRCTAWADLFH